MADTCHSLPYQGGYLALTETHLVVVQRQRVAEYLAFAHLGEARAEQAHSFRHRGWGIVCGALLLVPSVAVLLAGGNNFAAWGLFRGKLGFAALFGAFFGLLFLGGVLHSRRIGGCAFAMATRSRISRCRESMKMSWRSF